MAQAPSTDALLIERIRAGEPEAWNQLIGRFEGRLLAYVMARLRARPASEDVVQETFIGLLTSLPNYDLSRPLESYLFSIAAHKLTDHLRREGRRPTVPLSSGNSSDGSWEPPGRQRAASSILRSGERRQLETDALVEALRKQIDAWRKRDDWLKIECMELLFVRAAANKDVADRLGITEQQVANFKFDFLARIRKSVRRQGLPEDIFPELYRDS
ncbi:MAG: sigma-70 family RNA polymerase sigma factor [Planctomycetia bacterium]|nr:MAG: sigma-70 family RNA polymerase sigma factor [Planctomycetia bacterium]